VKLDMQLELLILTTKQNFQWTSMQEILPSLEEMWGNVSELQKLKTKIINVDDNEPKSFLKNYLRAKYIIVIAFNTKIATFIHYIRKVIGCDTQIFFHLHGLATIGCWPLSRFNVLDHLYESDVFLGTCEGDKKCLEVTFEKNKFIQHFFPITGEISLEASSLSKPHTLAYVGRISRQKNLHILLKCYLIAISNNENIPNLIFYGEEDNLGAPNLGISCKGYLNELIGMTPTIYINRKIFFRGFVERKKIIEELGINHTFISLSLHSDENFGMAALRSLSIGANAILSDWGGHKNFQPEFPQQAELVDVSFSKGLLSLCEDRVVQLISQLSIDSVLTRKQNIKCFQINTIAQKISNEIDKLTSQEHSKLKFQSLGETISLQQKKYETSGHPQQCFNNSADKAYQKLIECYL
jgi:glycosyltransferase involved in cell wall biosynthesis